MKHLLIAFAVFCAILGILTRIDRETNPYADGHLAFPPLPARIQTAEAAPLGTPGPLSQIDAPTAPAAVSATRMMVIEPEPENKRMAEVQEKDQSDWGIPRMAEPTPLLIASAPAPRLVNATPTPAPTPTPQAIFTPTPAPTVVVPNLYLPEGATNEEGAGLTLIKPELQVYAQPDVKSPAAPFTLKEGDRVRPLTRLRNETDFDWVKIERDGKPWWAQAEYFIRVDPKNTIASGSNLTVGEEAVDKDSALPVDYKPNDMVNLAGELVLGQKEIKLRREAADALAKMVSAAAADNIKLKVFSGFRDFNYQKKLYLDAIETHGPKQNGVAAPGYSEHQLGTTIDISNLDLKNVLSNRFGDTAEGHWLHDNAEKFGFRNSYTLENSDQVGYKAEPWHLRYVGTAVNSEAQKKRVAQK